LEKSKSKFGCREPEAVRKLLNHTFHYDFRNVSQISQPELMITGAQHCYNGDVSFPWGKWKI